MKFRNILYIVITIICVISIIIGIYYQIFKSESSSNNTNQNTTNISQIDLEKIKNNFNNLFTNELNLQGYEIEGNIKKSKENKEVIYTAYEIQKELENVYSININLPVFNISDDISKEFNKTTQKVFADKANEILKKSTQDGSYTIYNIDYAAFLNDNVLSLVIKSILKEGANAQRLIVQTYNYDLNTGKKANLLDILEEKQISKEYANKKIQEQVEYAYNKAEAVSIATMQNVYKRDLNSNIYLVDNVTNFFLGEDGKIYIIYAYGNSNFTSEIDIIEL